MNNKILDFKRMIGYAIKAPSGHNTQPWLFRIKEGEDRIRIVPDLTKELAVVDKDCRELFISLGCAAENLCIAAKDMGYEPAVTIDEYNTINVYLKKTGVAKPDSLCLQIDKRQTNRGKYDSRLISEDAIRQFRSVPLEDHVHAYFWRNQTEVFNLLKTYVAEGNCMQMGNKKFLEELKSWMRYNKKHAEEKNDGLSYAVFGAPDLPKFISRPVMGAFLNAKTQNKADMEKIASSSHFLLLTTQNNTEAEWIGLGRSLQRLLLVMTQQGVANAYVNQPCEVSELATKLQELLPVNNEYPTILLRIGYAEPAPYSKRKSIEEVCCLE